MKVAILTDTNSGIDEMKAKELEIPLFCRWNEVDEFFHTCCYFPVNGMLNRNRIIISSMYMVKIVLSEWNHP